MQLICPSCGSNALKLLGPIAPSNTFSGQGLEKEMAGGDLWRCDNCTIFFRYPRPSKLNIDELYRSGNEESWTAPVEKRTDWKVIKGWISSQKGLKRILDVGCFDGRLLEYLGGDYQWLGIEIHEAAAQRAKARGVEIITDDFGKLDDLEVSVDVAIAVDVIEHSYDPKKFLASLAKLVRAGGYIIVTTGNTSATTWRLMGSRYWYCHIAEHLSFINPSWAAIVAPQLGLVIEDIQRFSHAGGKPSFKQKAYEASANLLLRFVPKLYAWLRKSGAGGIDLKRYPNMELAPLYWMSAKDHMMLVFRKPSSI